MSPLTSLQSTSSPTRPINEIGYVRENLTFHIDAGNGEVGNSTDYAYNLVNGPRSDSNNYRLSFVNKPSYSYRTTLDGITASYWDFDGSNDYGYIEDSDSGSDFDFSTSETGDMTIEVWVNPEAIGYTDFIIGRWNYSYNSKRSFLFGWEEDRYEGMAWTGTSGTWHRTYVKDSSNRATGTWAHLVWSYRKADPDNSDNCFSCLYYNGVEATGSTDENPFTSWNDKTINSGSSRKAYVGVPWYYSWAYNGKLSVMRVYNGKALSANEVKRNYNSEAPRFNKATI